MKHCCEIKSYPETILESIRDIQRQVEFLSEVSNNLETLKRQVSLEHNLSYYDTQDLILKLKRLAMEHI